MKKLVCLLVIVALSLAGCGDASTTAELEKTPVVEKAPAVVKKWVETNAWEGNGTKNTEAFEVTENTRVNWETTSKEGILQIYVINLKGEPMDIIANIQGVGKDVSYLYLEAGKYSFNINSGNTPWKISVEQQK